MEEIVQRIKERFSKEIGPGKGRVVCVSGQDDLVPYSEVKRIDDRNGNGFALDSLLHGARVLFGNEVYVAYCTKGSSDISIQQFSGTSIFKKIIQ